MESLQFIITMYLLYLPTHLPTSITLALQANINHKLNHKGNIFSDSVVKCEVFGVVGKNLAAASEPTHTMGLKGL